MNASIFRPTSRGQKLVNDQLVDVPTNTPGIRGKVNASNSHSGIVTRPQDTLTHPPIKQLGKGEDYNYDVER